ncbi:hypothetical protein COP1_022625 [Malus domestica]
MAQRVGPSQVCGSSLAQFQAKLADLAGEEGRSIPSSDQLQNSTNTSHAIHGFKAIEEGKMTIPKFGPTVARVGWKTAWKVTVPVEIWEGFLRVVFCI